MSKLFFRSLGAVCDKEGKGQFSMIFHELLKGDLPENLKESLNLSVDIPAVDAPYAFPLPKENSVFSYKLTIGKTASARALKNIS